MLLIFAAPFTDSRTLNKLVFYILRKWWPLAELSKTEQVLALVFDTLCIKYFVAKEEKKLVEFLTKILY